MKKIEKIARIMSIKDDKELRTELDNLSEKDVRFMLLCLIKTVQKSNVGLDEFY